MFRACARRYDSTCGGRHLSKVTPATACGRRGIYGIRRIRAICGRCGIRTGFVEFIGFAGFVKSASSPERLFSAASSRATFLETSLRRRHVRVRLLAPLPKPVTVGRRGPCQCCWDVVSRPDCKRQRRRHSQLTFSFKPAVLVARTTSTDAKQHRYRELSTFRRFSLFVDILRIALVEHIF